MFSVRFFFFCGAIPCPGRNTVEFGGNTACLEIRAGKKLIIVDLGTGVKPLGDYLVSNDFKNTPIDLDILISHTHWDHIMGFPMFAPIFIPGTKLRIKGPVSYNDETLESIISEQLSYRYWPVRQSELAANIDYQELRETSFDMGEGLKLSTKYLNHPILCLGYRFEYQGKVIVTAFDHEPFRNVFPTDPNDPGYNEGFALEGDQIAMEENEKIRQFYSGADILIHDAQYTSEEFEKRLGWGHSSFEYAIEAACNAGVKKLVFFHHEPNNNDECLEILEEKYKNELKTRNLEVIMAREGLTVHA
jgi:ribonuclease BN (tRNA processing enzyme)